LAAVQAEPECNRDAGLFNPQDWKVLVGLFLLALMDSFLLCCGLVAI
jgi:hypothetical protein